MNDPRGVGRLQRGGDLLGDFERLYQRKRSLRQQHVQRLAFGELENEELMAVGFLYRVDAYDVGVVESRDRLGFALEALASLVVVGHLRRQHLERHLPVQLGVLGLIHVAHPPAAEVPDDLVVVEDRADQNEYSTPKSGEIRARTPPSLSLKIMLKSTSRSP